MGQFSWIYSDINKQLVDDKEADAYLLVPKKFQHKYGKALYEGCYDEDNFALEYPIKITSTEMEYEQANASRSDPNQGWEDWY